MFSVRCARDLEILLLLQCPEEKNSNNRARNALNKVPLRFLEDSEPTSPIGRGFQKLSLRNAQIVAGHLGRRSEA